MVVHPDIRTPAESQPQPQPAIRTRFQSAVPRRPGGRFESSSVAVDLVAAKGYDQGRTSESSVASSKPSVRFKVPAHPLSAARSLLQQFESLEPNWDSYGGEPISPVAIRRAHSFLDVVDRELAARHGERIRPFHVSPVGDGGVQLEWRGRGGELEVEIGPDGSHAALLVTKRDGHEACTEVSGYTRVEIISTFLRQVLAG